jgi:hypothetical protein
MADGSLAETAFRHYLVQDYLFLIEFARAYAVAVYKSPKLADMREAAAGLSSLLRPSPEPCVRARNRNALFAPLNAAHRTLMLRCSIILCGAIP